MRRFGEGAWTDGRTYGLSLGLQEAECPRAPPLRSSPSPAPPRNPLRARPARPRLPAGAPSPKPRENRCGHSAPAGQRAPPLGECRAPAPSSLPLPHHCPRPSHPLTPGSRTVLCYPFRGSHYAAPRVPRPPPARPVSSRAPSAHAPLVHSQGSLTAALGPYLPQSRSCIPTHSLSSLTVAIRWPWTQCARHRAEGPTETAHFASP